VSFDVSHKRSRKRCATHVYITHTIRSSKQGVTEESNLHECHETKVREGSKHGVHFKVHNFNRMRNGVVTSDTVRNPNESKNGILLQQCRYGELSQAASTSGVYGPQKQVRSRFFLVKMFPLIPFHVLITILIMQSFNLLSLSTGSYGLKIDDNNYNKVQSRLEPLSNLHVPYFQSIAQQQRVMPIPSHQSRYVSRVYLDHLTVVGPQVLINLSLLQEKMNKQILGPNFYTLFLIYEMRLLKFVAHSELNKLL